MLTHFYFGKLGTKITGHLRVLMIISGSLQSTGNTAETWGAGETVNTLQDIILKEKQKKSLMHLDRC